MLLFGKMQNIAAPPRHSEASFTSENSKPGMPSQGIGNVLWLPSCRMKAAFGFMSGVRGAMLYSYMHGLGVCMLIHIHIRHSIFVYYRRTYMYICTYLSTTWLVLDCMLFISTVKPSECWEANGEKLKLQVEILIFSVFLHGGNPEVTR